MNDTQNKATNTAPGEPGRNAGDASGPINGDLRVRVSADTRFMPWVPSPAPRVWRKRVHLTGPPESGQVTSLVRYDAGARFPPHGHPDGEEIFVLNGVFSDEHGDWPTGTYLLNPEGFRHAPFSQSGCELFVKLRQYPGRERRHVALDTRAGQWEPAPHPGVSRQVLYAQPGFTDTTRLERWSARTRPGKLAYADGAEFFVIEGALADERGVYPAGYWLRLPAGAHHHPFTDDGCTVYVKTGGLACLTSTPQM